ncbi:MAG: hypothetical protein MH472_04195 [Bacteroidia bacterium]|nr:hypothetical protein [Bacteroidia bacterium]
MKADLGVTRGRDKHLWPIFFRETTEASKKIEAAANLYMYYKYFSDSALYTHILPLYTYDSSKAGTKLNILSTYYPSLFVYQNLYTEKIKSYRFLEILPHINGIEYTRSEAGDYLKNNLLFLLWYKNDRVKQSSHLVFFPLYWNYKNKGPDKTQDNKLSLFLPLYLSHQIKTPHYLTKTKAITPIIWFNKGENSEVKETNNWIFPLYNWQQKMQLFQATRYNLAEPKLIVERKQTFFPLVWQNTKKELSYAAADSDFVRSKPFSVLSDSLQNHLLLEKNFYVFPVFGVNNKTNFESTAFNVHLFPIWYYKHHRLTDKHYLKNNLQHNYTTEVKSNYLIPFYFKNTSSTYNHTKLDSNSYHRKSTVLFPIYWRGKHYTITKIGSTINSKHLAILPFILSGYNRNKQQNYLAITPLFWNINSRKKEVNMLMPIYFHSKKNENDYETTSHLLLPVWHYKNSIRTLQLGKDNIAFQKKRSITFIPLYHQTKIDLNKDSKTKQVFNLQAFTPLVWTLKSEDKKFKTYFPFYWHYSSVQDGERSKFTMVFPILYSKEFQQKWWINKEVNDSGEYTEKYFTVFPIYHTKLFYSKVYQDKKGWIYKYNHTLMITPLIWRVSDSLETTNLLFPLFIHTQNSKDKRSGLNLGLVLFNRVKTDSSAQNHVLWPFIKFGQNPQEKSFYAKPFIWYTKSKELGNKEGLKSSLLVFPLYLNRQQKSLGSDHRIVALTPLFWNLKSKENRSTLLLPLFFRFKLKKAESTTLFPLFSYGKSLDSSDKKHVVISPIFWHLKHKKQTTNLLFPLFIYTKNIETNYSRLNLGLWLFNRVKTDTSTQNHVLWPLIGFGQNLQQKTFHVSPLIWYKKSEALSYLAILPIYFYQKTPRYSASYFAGPIFIKKQVFGEYKKLTFLAGVYKQTKYINGDFDKRFVHLLYANSKVNGDRLKALFPLYYVKDFKNGNRSVSYAFGFYNSMKKKIPNQEYYYKEARIFWFLRYKSNFAYLQSLGINFDRKKLK